MLLLSFASGYGYHRDELYFLAAGQHLDWAYPDQGVLTPLIARTMNAIGGDSLTLLRLPSALAAGLIVLLTAKTTQELGGSRRAEWIAAASVASAAIVLFAGHLLSTTTFDLLAWTAITWLAVRAISRSEDRLWLVVGAVFGIALLNKPLPAFLAAALAAGILIAGPRSLLRSPYLWGGAVLALILWAPWLLWQAGHNWPQLDVGRELAAGGSVSSEPWWAIVSFQLLLASPPLAPVWIAGLVSLFRDTELREFRFLAWSWLILACLFMLTGGKPYYLAGLLPVLIAAGSLQVDAWLHSSREHIRRGVLAVALLASAAVSAVVALPILPIEDVDPVLAFNKDVGETIGWPSFTETVARVYREAPGAGAAIILTGNYGEAGAIERFGPAHGLPKPFSGHNAYWEWGPPQDGPAPVIAVGLSPEDLALLRGCHLADRIEFNPSVENEAQGTGVLFCRGPRYPWSEIWPELRRLG